jgi:hypothetical protein
MILPHVRANVRFYLSVVMLAVYFSLLSALRIGWEGLNFGTWISRMQLREYSLDATKWVRLAKMFMFQVRMVSRLTNGRVWGLPTKSAR